jgi:hypothetical protein
MHPQDALLIKHKDTKCLDIFMEKIEKSKNKLTND